MIYQGRLISFLGLVCLLSACGKDHKSWESFPVAIYSDQSAVSTSEEMEDFKAALLFWESHAGKQLFDYKGEWEGAVPPAVGDLSSPNQIFGNVVFGLNPWPYGNQVVGKTMTISSSKNDIEASMIAVNTGFALCSADCARDFQSVSRRQLLAHELGHFLGLDHSQDPQDIMYPELKRGGSLTERRVDQVALQKVINED